jgi:hypothetical protein
MKNQVLKSVVQISASRNKYCNVKTPKMGKTWHFIFATVDTLKKILYSKDTKIKRKINLSQEQRKHNRKK